MVSIFIALLNAGVPPVFAEEQGEVEAYDEQWQGMGAGGVIGALAGGPPGFIIGIASGALIGHHHGLKGDLESARQTIIELSGLQQEAESDLQLIRREVLELRQDLTQGALIRGTQEQALIQARQRHDEQMNAIAMGFVINIQFRTESAELEPRFELMITRAANILRNFTEFEIHVDAYADHRGKSDFNEALTKRRANAVVQRLHAAGINDERIRECSQGESQAEYPETDAEGMDFDRRVVLSLHRLAS